MYQSKCCRWRRGLCSSFYECVIWDVGRTGLRVYEPVRSNVSVLLFTGTLGAVTPLGQAVVAAVTLPHSRVLRFSGPGHDVVVASECGRQIMVGCLSRPDDCQNRCLD
nr:alpha/beta hydrolase [Mycobacterium uberis]